MKSVIALTLLIISNMLSVVYAGNSSELDKQVISVASDALSAYLSSKDLDKFEIRQVGKILSLPKIKSKTNIVSRKIDADKISSRMLVWVDIKTKEKLSKSVPVWFAVKAHKSVLVAGENIGLRADIKRSDFQTKVVNIAPLYAKPVEIDADLNVLQLNKPLQKDHVLTINHVEDKPAVRSKKTVKVVLESNGIKLETLGIAKRDADIGDSVEVSPEGNSEESFVAKVIGEGLVLVSD